MSNFNPPSYSNSNYATTAQLNTKANISNNVIFGATTGTITNLSSTTGIIQDLTVSNNLTYGSLTLYKLNITTSTISRTYSTTGFILSTPNSTIVDTSSSGTVTNINCSSISAPVLTASLATTYTTASSFYISGPPTASTNVSLSTINPSGGPLALNVQGNALINGRLLLYQDATRGGMIHCTGNNIIIDAITNGSPMAVSIVPALSLSSNLTMGTGQFSLQTNAYIRVWNGSYLLLDAGIFSGTNWSKQGLLIRGYANNTYNETGSAGTRTDAVFVSFRSPILTATNTVTTTTGANMYLEDITQSTNQTISNNYALWSNGGVRIDKQLCMNITSVTGTTYTQLAADYCLLVSNTSAVAVTLRTSPPIGCILKIKDTSGTARNITITPASGNIDGSGTLVLISAYEKTELIYNGTNWFTI